MVAEVANVSANGFWLLVDERELFVPFKQFPWFRAATIEHPERYLLVSKVRQAARS